MKIQNSTPANSPVTAAFAKSRARKTTASIRNHMKWA
jgi:hypothetical protein